MLLFDVFVGFVPQAMSDAAGAGDRWICHRPECRRPFVPLDAKAATTEDPGEGAAGSKHSSLSNSGGAGGGVDTAAAAPVRLVPLAFSSKQLYLMHLALHEQEDRPVREEQLAKQEAAAARERQEAAYVHTQTRALQCMLTRAHTHASTSARGGKNTISVTDALLHRDLY